MEFEDKQKAKEVRVGETAGAAWGRQPMGQLAVGTQMPSRVAEACRCAIPVGLLCLSACLPPAHAQVVALLNGQQMGGKRRSAYFYDLWCFKYLPKFKWDHLTGAWRRGWGVWAGMRRRGAGGEVGWGRGGGATSATCAPPSSASCTCAFPAHHRRCTPLQWAPCHLPCMLATPCRGGQLPKGGARAAPGGGDLGCQARARLLPRVGSALPLPLIVDGACLCVCCAT